MSRPLHQQLRDHAALLEFRTLNAWQADLVQVSMLEAAHLLDPDDDLLLARLQLAIDDLEELNPDGQLQRDLGMAIARIRLAERAAHEALGRRDLLRPQSSS
jgi:hypothetical protein